MLTATRLPLYSISYLVRVWDILKSIFSYLPVALLISLDNSKMGWSDFAIVQCNPAQTLQSRRNHFVQWGQPLGFDEEGWVKRFILMEQGEWATHERYTTW